MEPIFVRWQLHYTRFCCNNVKQMPGIYTGTQNKQKFETELESFEK
jgi:hypothetical protein